jgi:GNAT superfamily N-acetyltransferase
MPTKTLITPVKNVFTTRPISRSRSGSGPLFARLPSHLHIDLLPGYHGLGLGTRLLRALLSELAALGSPGVHLEMSSGNAGAEAFYRSLGFQELFRDDAEDELIMGLELGDEDW